MDGKCWKDWEILLTIMFHQFESKEALTSLLLHEQNDKHWESSQAKYTLEKFSSICNKEINPPLSNTSNEDVQ